MRTIAAALSGAAFILAAGIQAQAADPPLTVDVASCKASNSTVTGFVGNYPAGGTGQMRQFLGIPYAAPPTGKNRWMPPQPVKCWSGNQAAMSFRGACAQNANTNEDCLYLNVFTQPTGTVKKQPVMVFIHGGALVGGAGTFFANPVNLVQQGVIVVTINYRLGALGFLAHPALDKVATKNTGNYGILDQIAALQWVQANIAKFGGDAKNVTIFGQSAGGLSVLTQLITPLSNKLFHKAIIESGALYFQASTLADAETQGATFGTNTGCGGGAAKSVATCLRGLSVATILANQSVLGQSTKLLRQDGVVLTEPMRTALMAGHVKKVPIINGSNHDENRFHINGNPTLGTGPNCSFVSNLVPGNYHNAILANSFPANQASNIEANYPPGGSALTANIAFADAQTDLAFACRALRVSKWITLKGGKIYSYEFNDATAPPYLFPPFKLKDGSTFPYAAYHGAELPYLFKMGGNNACGQAQTALTGAQNKLSAAMVTYWTTFAKTGDPNPASGLPNWPLFKPTGTMLSFIGTKPKSLKVSAFDTDHKCTSFWDTSSQ
jgi:para-nitrobenzyl esterase